MTVLIRFAALAMVFSFVIGCSGGSATTAPAKVSGAVTVDKKPLPKGLISFDPQDGGSVSSIEIVEGKYEGEARPGRNLIMISAPKQVPMEGAEGGETTMVDEETLPSRYNAEQGVPRVEKGRREHIQLRAEIKMISSGAAGPDAIAGQRMGRFLDTRAAAPDTTSHPASFLP